MLDKHPFSARIEEARNLYELAKGTQYEETCWDYLEAVLKLGRIAGGLRRRASINALPYGSATAPAAH